MATFSLLDDWLGFIANTSRIVGVFNRVNTDQRSIALASSKRIDISEYLTPTKSFRHSH